MISNHMIACIHALQTATYMAGQSGEGLDNDLLSVMCRDEMIAAVDDLEVEIQELHAQLAQAGSAMAPERLPD